MILAYTLRPARCAFLIMFLVPGLVGCISAINASACCSHYDCALVSGASIAIPFRREAFDGQIMLKA